MFIYNLKMAFRYLKKDRLYALINLTGLSVGLACCLMISLYVVSEFNFDHFHKNRENIYRLTTHEESEGNRRDYAHSFIPMASLLKSQFPEVEQAVRLFPYSVSVTNKERNLAFQEEQFFFVDPNFFKVFSFELSNGDVRTALSNPNNILITEIIGQRYFGSEDPVGKQLHLNDSLAYTVAGVFKKLPPNSNIQFDLVAPLSSVKNLIGDWVLGSVRNWYYPYVYTFIQMDKSGAERVNARLKDFESKFLPKEITKIRTHSLQPLAEVHFSSLENELQAGSNKRTLYIFIAIAVLILVIATANFINLFLSRILHRLRSVGIRKVVGANNGNIWWQTMVETFFFFSLSFVVAILLTKLFLPTFNSTLDIDLTLFTNNKFSWLLMLLVVLAAAIITGLFPALLLSRFKMLNIFKRESNVLFSKRKSFSLQSFFVVFQFTIAIALIIATVVIRSQLNFVQSKNLGFKKEQTLIVPIRDEALQNNFASVKNELSKVTGVTAVSAISNFPWAKGFYDFNTTVNNHGKIGQSNAYTLLVEDDFILTMGMKMKTGRGFSKHYRTDASTAFIINEAAAKKFGIESYEGVKLTMSDVAAGQPKKGELIGIVHNFNLESLHHPIQPLILTVSPAPYYLDNVVINLSTTSVASTLQQIESTFKKIRPARPFDYFFLDEAFDKLYKKESRLAALFNYFSILAIVISCLGLMGISAFAAVRRTKEIGIRKVLGASVNGIIVLLSKDFLKLVIIAAGIAFPIAWWVMNSWLHDFAYRINIEWWVFAVAGFAALLIALVTVSFQAIKAAISNPVKSLRTE